MKVRFYSIDKKKVIDFFNKIENLVFKNMLYYCVLFYVVGIYYKQKKYVFFNYLYVQVFDKCFEF